MRTVFAAAVGGLFVLAACTSPSTTADSSSSTQAVSTFGTASGPVDEIKWSLPYGEPNTIDPPNTAYYSSAFVADNLCEALSRFDPDYKIVDNLASLAQPDPLTLVYTLKPDVTFWDGSPMTPEDVVWSLQHASAPSTITSFLFVNVASIEATGDSEVTIKLKTPDALLPVELATFAGAIQEKDFSEKAGSKLGSPSTGVMCTGPFVLDAWEPGQSITMSANPTYWDQTRMPHAAKVTVSFTPDSASLAQALSSGEQDGAYEVPAAVIPTLRSATSGSLVFGEPSQLYLSLSFANHDGPLASTDVRKALFMTVDRAAIASVAYHGAATANYTALNRSSWDNGSIPTDARQLWTDAYQSFQQERSAWGSSSAIADAKQLATSGGYGGEPIVLATLAGDATLSQVAQLIQAEAAQAGFNLQIKPLQPIDYSNATFDPKAREGLDLLIGVSFNGAPNPLEPMQFVFLPGSFYNYTGYDDPTVTANINEAWKTTDPVEQAKLLIEAQSIYEQSYDVTALAQLSEVVYLNDRLGGAVTSFTYLNIPSLAAIGASG